jgi:hypothetical protein
MDRCATWTSSYRLVLGMVQDIDVQPEFGSKELLLSDGPDLEAAHTEAIWDVVFVRLSALQEYGWHAGLESLMWASDAVNGSLAELNWRKLQDEFSKLRESWVGTIIGHAKEHSAFFPAPDQNPAETDEDED